MPKGKCDVDFGPCSCGAFHTPAEALKVNPKTGVPCIPGCIKEGAHDTCHAGPYREEVRDLKPNYDVGGSIPYKPDETNPKDLQGVKKSRLSLVPASSLIYQALAMEDGVVKYGAYNWREKKVRASIYYEAAIRHLASWFDSREDNAEDSQKPHLGHALACIGILVDAIETGNLYDDRPKAGPAAALIKRYTKK